MPTANAITSLRLIRSPRKREGALAFGNGQAYRKGLPRTMTAKQPRLAMAGGIKRGNDGGRLRRQPRRAVLSKARRPSDLSDATELRPQRVVRGCIDAVQGDPKSLYGILELLEDRRKFWRNGVQLEDPALLRHEPVHAAESSGGHRRRPSLVREAVVRPWRMPGAHHPRRRQGV